MAIGIGKAKGTKACGSCKNNVSVIQININDKSIGLCAECSHVLLEKLIFAGKRVKG